MAFRPLILLPLAVFAVFGYLAWQGMQKGDQPLPSMMEGHEAAAIRVTPLGDGAPPTDADLRKPGVKLLNFWASWCEPCRAEHPMLDRLKSEGVTIYGINYKDKPEAAQKFLADMGNPYTLLGADAGPMALDWGVYGVPETYVIDGKGVVVLRIAGPISEAILNNTLRPAMVRAAQN
jgi:cytochrome c biogenesis protein CcmG/thiol:disulfide interchange protein DsbE